MRKLILTSILCLIALITIAQQGNFIATQVSFAYPVEGTDSLAWGEWNNTNVKIIFTTNQITVFSYLQQDYILTSPISKTQTEELLSLSFEAKGVFEDEVFIELVHWKDGNNQLYIMKENFGVVYQIERL